MASCGSWLLMVDCCFDFYLLNLLTLQRIDLPSMTLPILGEEVRFESKDSDYGYGSFVGPCSSYYQVSRDILEWKKSALLWIDETTGDYVVAWIFRQHFLFSHKKGDGSWWNLKPRVSPYWGFLDVACRNSKLYLLTTDQHIKIFDFSRGFPNEENPYRNRVFSFDEKPWEYVWKRKIAIEESGDVLIILSLKEVKYEEKLLFYVFKMNLESYKWERVDCIGDGNEILIFGHGVTVRAPPVQDCFRDGSSKRCLIYFVEDDVWPDHEDRASNCGVFDIATIRIEWPEKSCFYINKSQWFVPEVAYEYFV